MQLWQRSCDACRTATEALTSSQYEELLAQVVKWTVIDHHHLSKSIKTKNFKVALDLANKVGELAEAEGHHPDLLVRWGELKIDLWTHKVNGLTEADFVLASKIDQLTTAD